MTTTDPSVNTNWMLLFACWMTACVSSLGSIFFSEVMAFPPCVLCWYQRVFMFPLVFIFIAGLFPFDRNILKYALPITLVGWGVAFYHTLVYAGIIPENMQPCSQGVSCTETYLDLFGFISIPLLSLISFTLILVLLVVLHRRLSK